MEISGLKLGTSRAPCYAVALPDSFFAFDGMDETMLHVLDDMGIYDAIIDRDVERYLPFLSTTTLLMEAVQKGAGREQAHEAIKEHAVATALSLREGQPENDSQSDSQMMLVFPLDTAEIKAVLDRSQFFTGLCRTGKSINLHRRQRNWWNGVIYPEALGNKKGPSPVERFILTHSPPERTHIPCDINAVF